MFRWCLPCFSVLAFALASSFADPPAKSAALETDPPPEGAVARLGTNRLRLPNPPSYLAFSPEHSFLAVGINQETRFWDAKTWKEIWRVPSMAYSADTDGRHVATHSNYRDIVIWDIKDKKKLHTRNFSKFTKQVQVRDIEFLPGGKLMWVENMSDGLWLYDWREDKIVRKIAIANLDGAGICQSRNGKFVAMRHGRMNVSVWDSETTKLIRSFNGNGVNGNQQIDSYALSPKGNLLAVNNYQETTIYEVESGNVFMKHPGHSHLLTFDPARDFLIAGNDRIDLVSKKVQRSLFPEESFHREPTGIRRWFGYYSEPGARVSFSADGKIAAVGGRDGSIKILDGASFKSIIDDPHPRGAAARVAFSPAGDSVATMHDDSSNTVSGTVRHWKIDGPTVAKSITVTDRVDLNPLILKLRYPKASSLNFTWQSHPDEASQMQFSQDGKRILLGSFLNWDLATGKQMKRIIPEGRVLKMSDDGARWFVAKIASGDPRVDGIDSVEEFFLFDPATEKKLHKLPMPKYEREATKIHDFNPALSANGDIVAYTTSAMAVDPRNFGGDNLGAENHLVVWNAKTPEQSRILRLAFPVNPNYDVYYDGMERFPVAVSADGRILAAAVGQFGKPEVIHALSGFTLWRPSAEPERVPKNGRQWRVDEIAEAPMNGHDKQIAFSPDGHYLACANRQRIVLRESLTGEDWQTIRCDNGEIHQIVFSPDGRLLAAAAADSTTTLWKIAPFGSAKPGQWKAAEVEANWKALLGKAATAQQAMADLHAGGDDAVAFLRDRLRQVKEIDKQIPKMIEDLGSQVFRVREKASIFLAKEGFRVKPHLIDALGKSTELEQYRRLQLLVDRYRSSGLDVEEVRVCRAIVVLERIGTPTALAALETLARDHPAALDTQTALSAVARLRR